MNILQFKAELANIQNNLTLVYQLEAILRQYINSFNSYSTFSSKVEESKLFNYRLGMAAYTKFTSKSSKALPAFIYEKVEAETKNMFQYMFETPEMNHKHTYEYFRMIFDDTRVLHTLTTQGLSLLNFSELVYDKPVPFNNIDISLELNDNYSYIGSKPTINYSSYGYSLNHAVSTVYHLESMLKYTKHADKSKYIYIHKHLDKAYEGLLKDTSKYTDVEAGINTYASDLIETSSKINKRLELSKEQ